MLMSIHSVIPRDLALRNKIQLTPVLSIWNLNLTYVVIQAHTDVSAYIIRLFKCQYASFLRRQWEFECQHHFNSLRQFRKCSAAVLYSRIRAPICLHQKLNLLQLKLMFVRLGLKTVVKPYHFFHCITGKLCGIFFSTMQIRSCL